MKSIVKIHFSWDLDFSNVISDVIALLKHQVIGGSRNGHWLYKSIPAYDVTSRHGIASLVSEDRLVHGDCFVK